MRTGIPNVMRVLKVRLGRRSTRRESHRRLRLWTEGLEQRRMLAGDVAAVVGDSDLDGVFDSGDIVQVFQHGRFEKDAEAGWEHGDWNSDGRFNTADLVYAFQFSNYGRRGPVDPQEAFGVPSPKAQRGGHHDDDSTGEEMSDEAEMSGEDDSHDHPVRENNGRRIGMRRDGAHRSLKSHHAGIGGVEALIERLTTALESGDPLPGNLTAEEAEAMIAALQAATEGDEVDRGAIRDILTSFRSDKQADRVQAEIDELTELLESGDELPGEVTAEQVQAAIDGATEALANDDLNMARDLIRDIHHQLRDAARDDALTDHLQARIDHLQAALESGDLPGNLNADQVEALIAALEEAQASGEFRGIGETMREIRHDANLQRTLDRLNEAVEAGEGWGPWTAEETAELAVGLAAALEAGDLEAAKALLLEARRAHRGSHSDEDPTDEDPTDEDPTDDGETGGDEGEMGDGDDEADDDHGKGPNRRPLTHGRPIDNPVGRR